MSTTASCVVEIPEALLNGVSSFLEQNPSWDQESVMASAIALFLIQHNAASKETKQIYLDSLFKREVSND